jgi:hypothetical protein
MVLKMQFKKCIKYHFPVPDLNYIEVYKNYCR